MKKKTNKVAASDRPDVAAMRAGEDTYIFKPEKIDLSDIRQYVRRAYEAGVELHNIVIRSGLRVHSVYDILGLDKVTDSVRYNALVKYREEYLISPCVEWR